MKALFSLIATFSLVVHAQAPSSPNVENKVFSIEQETSQFQLQHIEKEPIFETQQQPATCYRTVQHGTRQECHTEYDQQCETRMEQECQDIPYPVCQTVQEPICQSVPRQACHTEGQRVCQTVPRRECHNENRQVCHNESQNVCQTVQECTTVQDHVCRGAPPNQVCQTVPRRQCSPVQRCTTQTHPVCHNEQQSVCQTVNDQVCHTEPRNVCHTEYDNVCHNESRQRCHDEYRQECHNVPRQHCENIPRQACEQVPNMEQEPYACTQPVQVQVGEKIKSSLIANVKVLIANFGKTPLSKDEFSIALTQNSEGEDIALKLGKNDQKTIYRLLKKERSVQTISATEKILTVVYTLELIPVESLAAYKNLKIVEPKIFYDKLQFKIQGMSANLPTNQTLIFDQGAIQVLKYKRRTIYTILDQKFDPAAKIRKVGEFYEVPFINFGFQYLDGYEHSATLDLKLKSIFDKKEILNPELLDQATLGNLKGEFEGFPIE